MHSTHSITAITICTLTLETFDTPTNSLTVSDTFPHSVVNFRLPLVVHASMEFIFRKKVCVFQQTLWSHCYATTAGLLLPHFSWSSTIQKWLKRQLHVIYLRIIFICFSCKEIDVVLLLVDKDGMPNGVL